MASGSALVYDLVFTMMTGSPHLDPDVREGLEHSLSFDPDQRVIGMGQFMSCIGGVLSGVITDQLELAHLFVDRFQAMSERLNLVPSWHFPYAQSLLAAAEGNLSDARSLMGVSRSREESGRVGPTRADFLLVPATVAAGEGRYADCAGLLEVLRSNPVPLSWGGHVSIYLLLRNLAGKALEPDQLAVAREAGRQLDTDTALDAFMHAGLAVSAISQRPNLDSNSRV